VNRRPINRLMAIVAIIAVDFVVVCELSNSRIFSAFWEWCFIAAIPMASILALSIPKLLKRPKPFATGFWYFGVAAMLCIVAAGKLYPEAARYPLRAMLNPLFQQLGSNDSYRPFFLGAAALFPRVPLDDFLGRPASVPCTGKSFTAAISHGGHAPWP
jgi:hypothetical protein